MDPITTSNLPDRFNKWIQESIMIKLFSIGFLILILLIPSSWIQSLMEERQQRADEVVNEITDKWSGSQVITGPILVIPYKKTEIIENEKGDKKIREFVERAYFLPEKLNVDGDLSTEVLHRGIFDAVVYESQLKINSSFNKPDFKTLSIEETDVMWNDAYMVFGISDLRGISDTPDFKINGVAYATEPTNTIGVSVSKKREPANYSNGLIYDSTEPTFVAGTGILAPLKWENAESFKSDVAINLKLKGSSRMDFIPVGKNTQVKLTSAWMNPSFVGEFLPATRDLTNGFTASWSVLHYNRPFSQQWTESNQNLSDADFGVKLLMPVDQYQKSIRTAKYSVLIILLTFMALFLVEITQKVRIHPFQYILVGAALIIYYTLLLSFSEHIGYNLAYVIASLATVVLIALYSKTFFNDKKMPGLFGALLVIFYGFIFVIIQEQDFSLLLGSIGLFAIIGALMYFSRNVNWYKNTVSR